MEFKNDYELLIKNITIKIDVYILSIKIFKNNKKYIINKYNNTFDIDCGIFIYLTNLVNNIIITSNKDPISKKYTYNS